MTRGRRDGMHADTMPMETSVAVHTGMSVCIPVYDGEISEGGREIGRGVNRQAKSLNLMRWRTTRRITLTTQTLIKKWLAVEFYSCEKGIDGQSSNAEDAS